MLLLLLLPPSPPPLKLPVFSFGYFKAIIKWWLRFLAFDSLSLTRLYALRVIPYLHSSNILSISKKHRSPSTILPQLLLLLLLYRDDVFSITFHNHSYSTHTLHGVSFAEEDQTEPNSSIFHCSVRCCCETSKFEIFMCYSSTSFRFPSPPSRLMCSRRSLSYFSKYIMALKYISCALYT